MEVKDKKIFIRKQDKMKKLLLISVLILLSTGVYSQVNFIVKCGPAWSHYSDNDGNTTDKKSGLFLGADIDLPMSDIASFRTGLSYISKGAKESGEDNVNISGQTYSANVEETINQNYLEIPFRVVFHLPLGDGFNLMASAGAYMAYGINGKIKVAAKANGYTSTVETNTFDRNQNINRFDAGYMFGAGISYKRIQLELNAENGFTSILKTTMGDQSVFNRSLVLTLGYQINK